MFKVTCGSPYYTHQNRAVLWFFLLVHRDASRGKAWGLESPKYLSSKLYCFKSFRTWPFSFPKFFHHGYRVLMVLIVFRQLINLVDKQHGCFWTITKWNIFSNKQFLGHSNPYFSNPYSIHKVFLGSMVLRIIWKACYTMDCWALPPWMYDSVGLGWDPNWSF